MTSLDLRHLFALSTPTGLYEHALGAEPRVEHGMCVDDVARGLLVTSRISDPSAEVEHLAATYLTFLTDAQHDDGRMHNRRNPDGSWADEATADDHWGRAVWAFGTAAACSADPVTAARAAQAATVGLRARSRWPRAMSYASLGASLVLGTAPGTPEAWLLLRDTRRVIGRARMDRTWPWPQDVLSYANAVLPEAMLVLGRHLDAPDLRDDGRYLLQWLIDQQTVDDHLSLIPVGGRRRGEPKSVGFDQQPIEVACLAEACHTAYLETGDPRWSAMVHRCLDWFEGANDVGVRMYDEATGGGYDGLEPASVNRNQGAESTLAWLATAQLSQLNRVAVAS